VFLRVQLLHEVLHVQVDVFLPIPSQHLLHIRQRHSFRLDRRTRLRVLRSATHDPVSFLQSVLHGPQPVVEHARRHRPLFDDVLLGNDEQVRQVLVLPDGLAGQACFLPTS